MFDGQIERFEVLIQALEKAAKLKKPILVIAEGFTKDAINGFVINKTRGGYHWVATKTPGFGEQKKEMIQDICAMVGGKVFNESIGHKYDEIDDSFFGFAKRVVVGKDSTTVLEGKSDPVVRGERVELLKAMLAGEESDYNREKLSERLGKLNGGVGLIKIGASTETELKEKRYRYEDALNATRAAIDEGIVPGGGSCLLRISDLLEDRTTVDERDEDEVKGLRILAHAMKAPFRQICTNGDFSPDVFARKVLESEGSVGFDAKYGDVCDLFERGVIDPAKVTKTALTNAVSIASLVLTTETLIAPIIDKSEKVLVSEGMF
jgi:chaperonin GroEL